MSATDDPMKKAQYTFSFAIRNGYGTHNALSAAKSVYRLAGGTMDLHILAGGKTLGEFPPPQVSPMPK